MACAGFEPLLPATLISVWVMYRVPSVSSSAQHTACACALPHVGVPSVSSHSVASRLVRSLVRKVISLPPLICGLSASPDFGRTAPLFTENVTIDIILIFFSTNFCRILVDNF